MRIGATLADGWFRGRLAVHRLRPRQLALLAQVVITYADGRVQVVGSDVTWQTAAGPILKSDIYDGEDYDARLEEPGWSTAAYSADGWSGVRVSTHTPAKLVAPVGPPVRRIDTLSPVSIQLRSSGELDCRPGAEHGGLGAAAACAARPAPRSPAPRRSARCGRRPLPGQHCAARCKPTATPCAGDGVEVFEPHFTFRAFAM